MTSPREIAEAFSGHRFRETYDQLAPDVRWVLVGDQLVQGRDSVIALCEETLTALADTTTEFDRFLTIAEGAAVAVDVVARYRDAEGTTTVSSCDLFEFDGESVVRITSYTVELTDPG